LGIAFFIRFTKDGKRPRYRIGLKSELGSKAKASRAAQHIRDQFNAPDAKALAATRTFGDVVDRYELEEMPERYSTRKGYKLIHKGYVRPKWGGVLLSDMNAQEMRKWILELPLAPKTKGNIMVQMSSLFRFAMFWEWIPAVVNPTSLFRIPGISKRVRKPRVITPAQWREILRGQTSIHIRTMLIGAFCLGLRVSELFALKWSDFDHLGSVVHIRRAIVDGRVGLVKTERSDAPLPLADAVNQAFLALRARSLFSHDEDWVFASERVMGKRPMNSKFIQQELLIPAGKAIGLDFNLGWHTMRHSYKVLLERAGTDVTVQRDLMRHANTNTTMNVYGEIEMDRMRDANNKAVALAFGEDAH
jgi:integrase